MKVSVSTLEGHTSSVLCVALDHTNNSSCVAAGAESGTTPIRLWDTRINGKTCQLAIHTHGAATASSSSSSSSTVPFHNGVTSVAFAPGHLLFCSWEQSIAAYDLRLPNKTVLQSCDDHVWLLENFATDEINQISISAVQASGKWKVACCEDGGDVHVFHAGADLDAIGIDHTVLSGVHTNLCTGVRWQPGSMRCLYSGSMDATICMWDVSKSKPITGGHITCGNDATGASTTGGSQLLNPPFVNSLDVSPSVCAVGLGDGTIGLYNTRTQQSLGRLRGHDSATACVTFARSVCDDEEGEAKEGNTQTWNHLFSAGNDQKICLWNLDEGTNGGGGRSGGRSGGRGGGDNEDQEEWDEYLKESTTTPSSRSSKSKKHKKKGKRRKKKKKNEEQRPNETKDTEAEEDTNSGQKETAVDPNDDRIPVRFEHPHKINWLDASKSRNGGMRLFVADESNAITVYSGFQ
jgi:WD40 repeat protein